LPGVPEEWLLGFIDFSVYSIVVSGEPFCGLAGFVLYPATPLLGQTVARPNHRPSSKVTLPENACDAADKPVLIS
jgi:hypothetical protein